MASTYVGLSPPNHTHYLVICSLGLDLIGPFKKAPGGCNHLLVAVDKFTKLIEARPIVKLTSSEATSFFRDIVYYFVVPNSIIIDNRS